MRQDKLAILVLKTLNEDIIPELIIPNYNTGNDGKTGNSVSGQGLERLGYEKGTIKKGI